MAEKKTNFVKLDAPRVHNSWILIRAGLKFFSRYPQALAPLLITWLIYAISVLVIECWINWDALAFWPALALLFLIVCWFSALLSFSFAVLLELIMQHESGQEMDIFKAYRNFFGCGFVRLLPMALIWLLVWFILLIIQAFLLKDKNRAQDEKLTAENAARTLIGFDGNFTLLRAFLEALERGIRMIVFLVIPAIIWENLPTKAAVKKSLIVFRRHLVHFMAGFGLAEVATLIVFVPLAVTLKLADMAEASFPLAVWYLVSLYIAFTWSFSFYLEQVFLAELYFWHLAWENQMAQAQAGGHPIPEFDQIKLPLLLDENPDLIKSSESVEKRS